MSKEKSHLYSNYNGYEPISFTEKDNNYSCNFCIYDEDAIYTTSKMISTNIWPPPPPDMDRPMQIGRQCLFRYIIENPKHVIFHILKNIIGNDSAELVIQYL